MNLRIKLDSTERGEFERDFGVGIRRYSLGCIMTKFKHTTEVAVHVVVLIINLWRITRLLFAFAFVPLSYTWNNMDQTLI